MLLLQDLFGAAAVSSVGSVDPINNFNAMIARRDVDLMDKAIGGMQTQIDRWASCVAHAVFFCIRTVCISVVLQFHCGRPLVLLQSC